MGGSHSSSHITEVTAHLSNTFMGSVNTYAKSEYTVDSKIVQKAEIVLIGFSADDCKITIQQDGSQLVANQAKMNKCMGAGNWGDDSNLLKKLSEMITGMNESFLSMIQEAARGSGHDMHSSRWYAKHTKQSVQNVVNAYMDNYFSFGYQSSVEEYVSLETQATQELKISMIGFTCNKSSISISQKQVQEVNNQVLSLGGIGEMQKKMRDFLAGGSLPDNWGNGGGFLGGVGFQHDTEAGNPEGYFALIEAIQEESKKKNRTTDTLLICVLILIPMVGLALGYVVSGGDKVSYEVVKNDSFSFLSDALGPPVQLPPTLTGDSTWIVIGLVILGGIGVAVLVWWLVKDKMPWYQKDAGFMGSGLITDGDLVVEVEEVFPGGM